MAGPADWGAVPVSPIAANSPQAWGAVPAPTEVGVGEDIAKTAAPSTLRGIVALMTTIPSIESLIDKGASWGLNKFFPDSDATGAVNALNALNKDKKGNDITKRYDYPTVQKAIEDKVTGPLYTAKTGPGKVAQSAIEFAPSAALGGAPAMIKGAFAGAGSELAGQGAEAAGYPEYATAARLGGAVAGHAVPAAARATWTPFPATAAQNDAVSLLKQEAPGMPMTASQRTGSDFLAKLEGLNKDSVGAPSWVKDLPSSQGKGFTTATMRTMGSSAESALPANLNAGIKDLQDAYKPLIKSAEVKPLQFNLLSNEINVRAKKFLKEAGVGNTDTVDKVVKDITLGVSGAPMKSVSLAGIPGERYQFLREDIQNKISSAGTASEKRALSDIREALDRSMYSSLPKAEAEALKTLNTQYANSKIISASNIDEAGHVLPKALKDSIVAKRGREAYNLDRGELAPLARAGSAVLKPLEAPAASTHPLAHGVGAAAGGLYGLLTGTGMGEKILAGTFGLPNIIGALEQNPLVARMAFSKAGQGYLGNQAWKPGAGTSLDPALVARLLALSPESQGK